MNKILQLTLLISLTVFTRQYQHENNKFSFKSFLNQEKPFFELNSHDSSHIPDNYGIFESNGNLAMPSVIDSYEDRIKTLESEILRMSYMNEPTRREQSETSKLKTKVIKLEKENKSLNQKLSSSSSVNYEVLRQEIFDLTTKNIMLKSRVAEAEKKANHAGTEQLGIKVLKERVKELEKENFQLKKEQAQTMKIIENIKTNNIFVKNNEEENIWKQKYKTLEAESSSCRTLLPIYDKKIKDFIKEKADLEFQIENFSVSKQGENEHVKKMENEFAKCKHTVDELFDELEIFKKKENTVNDSMQVVFDEMKEVNTNLQDLSNIDEFNVSNNSSVTDDKKYNTFSVKNLITLSVFINEKFKSIKGIIKDCHNDTTVQVKGKLNDDKPAQTHILIGKSPH